jgi:hypothetical protein
MGCSIMEEGLTPAASGAACCTAFAAPGAPGECAAVLEPGDTFTVPSGACASFARCPTACRPGAPRAVGPGGAGRPAQPMVEGLRTRSPPDGRDGRIAQDAQRDAGAAFHHHWLEERAAYRRRATGRARNRRSAACVVNGGLSTTTSSVAVAGSGSPTMMRSRFGRSISVRSPRAVARWRRVERRR